jgi:hypothetical protein
MPSDLQRVAQALVERLDQVPQIVEYLQRLAQRCRDNAGYLADISNHPAARNAALELDMAARCCDDAAHLLSLTPLQARAWAEQMVSGVRTAGESSVSGTAPTRQPPMMGRTGRSSSGPSTTGSGESATIERGGSLSALAGASWRARPSAKDPRYLGRPRRAGQRARQRR